MRDELERLAATHGLPWIVALVAMAVRTAFSDGRKTVGNVLKSILASILITFVIVEYFDGQLANGELFAVVAVASLLSHEIIEVILWTGKQVRRDPSILLRWFGGKK